MINILYIHGYGGTGNSRTAKALQSSLPENYTVFEPCFPLDINEALELAQETIRTKKIDRVVASSLGAFTAMQLRGIPKILINPCLYPSKELPKRIELPETVLSNFKTVEKHTFENIDDTEKAHTFGVFSTHDELFSYKDEFSEHYPNIQTIEDTHRISVENVEKVIAPMIEKMDKTRFFRGLGYLDLKDCGPILFEFLYEAGFKDLFELSTFVRGFDNEVALFQDLVSVLPKDTPTAMMVATRLFERFTTINHTWLTLALRIPGIGFKAAYIIGLILSGFNVKFEYETAIAGVLKNTALCDLIRKNSNPVVLEDYKIDSKFSFETKIIRQKEVIVEIEVIEK